MSKRVPRGRAGRARDDRGAVSIIVAVLLASGVLLGMAALVVDVGNLYVEREQLQSGADAGAIKVAQSCAQDPSTCTSAAGAALAGPYADANAKDGASGVALVCGRGGTLPACPAWTGAASDCVRAAPSTGPYVQVHTSTHTGSGDTVLPPVFAQSLVGGYTGTAVRTCARAAWGPPANPGSSLAVTLSQCEWLAATNNGTSFPDPPASDTVIYLHSTPDATPCRPAGPSGADLPGGFGWLDETAGSCRTRIAADGTYGANPGNNAPSGCTAVLGELRRSEQPALVPVYKATRGQGQKATYTLLGLAAFVVTGWREPGNTSQPSIRTGTHLCKGPERCLYGYFVRALVPAGGDVGGVDLGAHVVTLVG